MRPRHFSRLAFRTRLALALGGLFLLSGTALLAFVVVLALYGTAQKTADASITPVGAPAFGKASPTGADPAPVASDGVAVRLVESTVRAVQHTALQQMVLWSTVGLVLMTALVVLIGRWLAGRVLRPVAAVTAAALRISEASLDKRLGLTGPDDELHRLADAFDSMLDRLQRSFDSQRRFVANASHELRTPLAAQRTSIEVGLADPLPAHLVETREDLLTTNREAEQLIASLLLLARSDRGLEHTEQVHLADLANAATTGLRQVAVEKGLALHTRWCNPAQVTGDPVLIRHLISNLVSNALQYNRPDGRVEVTLDGGSLTVTNTGRPVDPDRIHDLFEPFRRLSQDRTGASGHGLGLSIVRSIVQAHGADLHAEPGPDGGLKVTVRFT
ncbi:sensor histidine kinase [Streptomyces sp. NPDC002144]